MLLCGNKILIIILAVVMFPTDKSKIDLSTCVSLKVVKIIYEYPREEKSNWFGDGYYGKIVRVKENDMKNFINNLTRIDLSKRQWRKGELVKYKLHLEVLETIEASIKVMAGKKEVKKLNRVINLKKLKQNKKIYHKIKYRKSGGFIRDAKIWILIPDENIVCIFSHHT